MRQLQWVNVLICIAVLTACGAAPPKSEPMKRAPRPAKTAAPQPEESKKPSPPVVAPAKTVVTIEALALTFELPSSAWKAHPGLGPAPPGITQVGFERDELHDASGNAVRPFCGIMSELVPPESRKIVEYSVSWRLRVPFTVDAVFSHESGPLQLKNAIGYRGRKTYGNTEHSLIVVHGLFRDRGFVISCDTTTAVLPQVQGEFEALLQSMKHTEEP